MIEVLKGNWPLAMGAAAFCVLLICIWTLIGRRRAEKKRDEKRLKDQVLNQAIRNSLGKEQTSGEWMESTGVLTYAKESAVVVRLAVMGRKGGSYVVNPDREVVIGKSPGPGGIVLSAPGVGERHCCLFASRGAVYMKSLDASLRTEIRRGFYRTPAGMKGIRLYTNDLVCAGSLKIRITLMDHTGHVIAE